MTNTRFRRRPSRLPGQPFRLALKDPLPGAKDLGELGEGVQLAIGYCDHCCASRTSTRKPRLLSSPPGATATTRPQQSVPWINGNGVASFRPPSVFAFAFSLSAALRSSVPAVTADEYHPRRVLISVLFTPVARTCRRTSPAASCGIGTFRYSSYSYRPLPFVTTAFMVVLQPVISKRSLFRVVPCSLTISFPLKVSPTCKQTIRLTGFGIPCHFSVQS